MEQLLPYFRVIAYLYPKSRKSQTTSQRERSFYGKIRSKVAELVPEELSLFVRNLTEDDIEKAISDEDANKKAYHSLCYSLLRIILLHDEWRITYAEHSRFEDNVFGMALQDISSVKPDGVPENIAFVARNDSNPNGNKNILFCFYDQGSDILGKVSSEIKKLDDGKFENICVMVVPSLETMQDLRRVSKADEWQRGFFMCFPEIRQKYQHLNGKKYMKLCANTSNPVTDFAERSKILTETVEVLDNIAVGEESHNHYKLRFKTSHSFNITPGQFIMMATSSHKHDDAVSRPTNWDNLKSSFLIKPASYLKRPFGIHRAFYPHFDIPYLQKLSLPPELATILHTVFPNQFEIFYKVLENGVGTHELTRSRKGDKIQIVGPLGKKLHMKELRAPGFEEIHVIGGGVGMAPLIFMVQALRYYSYPVKAFIGTEKIGMLKYRCTRDGLENLDNLSNLDNTFSEEPRDAIIYVDDLMETGVDPADIYVSSTVLENYDWKIPRDNLYEGFVTGQYNLYLQNLQRERRQIKQRQKNILAFACGPMGMMKALATITTEYGIKLKVLMEKRMACGIGVCLSCVCETKNGESGESKYSRVCTDGPIFDAAEIVW